jgi:hypothetical protein
VIGQEGVRGQLHLKSRSGESGQERGEGKEGGGKSSRTSSRLLTSDGGDIVPQQLAEGRGSCVRGIAVGCEGRCL